MKILKYQFEIKDRIAIDMIANCKILSVQIQNGVPSMWVLVDDDWCLQANTKQKREFSIYGTGWDIQTNVGNYIATIQLDGFVWHIFED